jgi:hypothetical protein
MSQSLRSRPSILLGIENVALAFYFDRAVWSFGSNLQYLLDKAESEAKTPAAAKSKKVLILSSWITDGHQQNRFRDPMK